MNNNVSNKRQCMDIYYPNLISDNPPFATSSSIQIPNTILRHHTVSFLSFREQSETLALVSKAFNALATFAREEQDWKDHTVDATPIECCAEEEGSLYLRDYIQWQKSKPTDKSIDFSSSFIYLEIFNKKIHLINKIENLFHDPSKEFPLSLLVLKQTNIKQILQISVNLDDDFFFEQVSNKCQRIELLQFNLEHDDYNDKRNEYVPIRENSLKGFVHLLQKCKEVKLNLKKLQDDKDVNFLAESIIKCVSLDPNFIMPLHSLETYFMSLDEKLNPILYHSNNLIHFTAYEGEDNLITENFVNGLACCTRLESIYIRGHSFKFHSNSLEGLMASQEGLIACHDQAFANLFRSCTFIKSFTYLSAIGLGDYFFRSLCSHPRIEDVNISIVLSPQIFEGNLQCPSLKRFTLKIDDYGKEGCFRDHGIVTKLGFRVLESANTVTKAVATFFPNLEEFEIDNDWKRRWGFNVKLTDDALLAFSFLTNLKRLDFDAIHEYPSQTALISWAKHPKLETINFEIRSNDGEGNQILSPEKISFMDAFLKEKFKKVRKYPYFYVLDYECIPTTKINSIN